MPAGSAAGRRSGSRIRSADPVATARCRNDDGRGRWVRASGLVTAAAKTGRRATGSDGGCEPLGWGHWCTLRELEEATTVFTPEHIVGEAEREFKVQVEAIGGVRHKNLVRLLGYCADGAHRILLYEYVYNGNLEQLLHGDVGLGSRLGTPGQDIKLTNILLDKRWNPKVSDFGLAKLLGSDSNYVAIRVMGTFGYVAPEYASTGMLNERSDVHNFGILIMEIISRRSPMAEEYVSQQHRYSKSAIEVSTRMTANFTHRAAGPKLALAEQRARDRCKNSIRGNDNGMWICAMVNWRMKIR
uniref:Protein kinase domain-containing protein n=1 Tax=Leersia perrieri TaxID=77586 RepID=A0A0D9WUQ2_9ORYZ